MPPFIVLTIIVDTIALILALITGYVLYGNPLDFEQTQYIWCGALLLTVLVQGPLLLLYRKR